MAVGVSAPGNRHYLARKRAWRDALRKEAQFGQVYYSRGHGRYGSFRTAALPADGAFRRILPERRISQVRQRPPDDQPRPAAYAPQDGNVPPPVGVAGDPAVQDIHHSFGWLGGS